MPALFTTKAGIAIPKMQILIFQLVSAHEFSHSVLMYAGGIPLSWGHKGSTGVLSQSAKSSTPGYPKSGAIDIMKYYDWKKILPPFNGE